MEDEDSFIDRLSIGTWELWSGMRIGELRLAINADLKLCTRGVEGSGLSSMNASCSLSKQQDHPL